MELEVRLQYGWHRVDGGEGWIVYLLEILPENELYYGESGSAVMVVEYKSSALTASRQEGQREASNPDVNDCTDLGYREDFCFEAPMTAMSSSKDLPRRKPESRWSDWHWFIILKR